MHEKTFIEKLDTIKKSINIWSSRGLSQYGKLTIIKALIIPKIIYIFSLLPTLIEVIKALNQLLFKFLWKGVDKVTRLSVINEYEKGGLNMMDLECLIKSLRLAWLKRIFGINSGAWKCYLFKLLERFGGPFFLHCNYDIKGYLISSPFYCELLQWWSDFRQEFATGHDWKNIMCNNKEIRVNKLPVFYKGFFDSDIIYVKDLLFDLSITDSFNIISEDR